MRKYSKNPILVGKIPKFYTHSSRALGWVELVDDDGNGLGWFPNLGAVLIRIGFL